MITWDYFWSVGLGTPLLWDPVPADGDHWGGLETPLLWDPAPADAGHRGASPRFLLA